YYGKAIVPINESSYFQLLETTNTSAKHKAKKGKGGRPKMPIWNDYSKDKEDRYGILEQVFIIVRRGSGNVESLLL
ncbi:28844_t:CDS:1, partial [Gigaspora margarita]